MTYPNALFSAFAFIGFLMCAIPLPWHIQTWSTGTCLYMVWTGLACLNQFINSIVWTGNAINWAPVWCDISSKFIIGVSTAIPAASLCINRRLYHVVTIRGVINATRSDKRNAVMIDLAIGLGLPALAMALHYIIQGHRFDIFEDVGCYPSSYYVWPIYPILLLPPIFIGLFSATYATLTIVTFHKKRSQISALLSSSNNFPSNRFIRLMCLASAEILFTIPIALYNISVVARQHLNPWISWENVHVHFSKVQLSPALIWRSNKTEQIALELTRWATVFCAFVFFCLIGFTEDARKNYRLAIQSVAKRLGISIGSSGSNLNSSRTTGMKSNVIGGGLNRSNVIGTHEMRPKVIGSTGKPRPVVPLSVHEDMFEDDDTIYLSFPP